ncbi:GntP family permease [Lutimonas zeaxanthinifaciens]|uniref:GntP family permease n=1 Tax=Lutimonas zeaxanthinifaciens TaxID=3060215 RepID=UPI00265D0B4B|nr:GntP family permease [Lutimonas sp. YSD2104]WKK67339.1 GntP family permease [Lutimonas sp. YSD2104]
MLIFISLVIVVALMVLASSKFHVHPFLSLLFAGIVMGFIGGLSEVEVTKTLIDGFGSTLGSIGIIIAFGAIIGVYLERSGGAMALANWVIKKVGDKNAPLAMNLTGFVVSIPVYCDSGFIILSSLIKAISRKSGISLIVLGVSLAAGLYATHVFIPPTPGPLAAAAALDADIGLVILFGLVVAVPVALTGMLWAKYIGSRAEAKDEGESGKTIVKEEDSGAVEESDSGKVRTELPKTYRSFAPILVPIILIALNSIASYPASPFGEGNLTDFLKFVGNPVIALLTGVILVFRLKGPQVTQSHSHWVGEGLKQAGVIILITGAGGAFGAILRATGIGDFIGDRFSGLELGLLLPFIISAVLKTAQGSSTVAIITTAAIVAPILESFGLDSATGRALTVLSVGAGAMTVSHINDSFFWVVSQFSGMDTNTALKSQTVATLLQGLVGALIVMGLGLVFI